jgi:hypothetical protein
MLLQKLKDLGFQGLVHKALAELQKPSDTLADSPFNGP